LLLEELLKLAQDHLLEKHTKWIQQDFVSVINIVFKLTVCKKLQDYCLGLICVNPQTLIPLLDKDILFDLLKRDDFQVEEIEIWNFLIEWGIKRTPGLKSKKKNKVLKVMAALLFWKRRGDEWTNKNYEDLENTLRDLIPLIRFSDITSKDFHSKVHPYERIIPRQIYDETLSYLLKGTLPKTLNMVSRVISSSIIKPCLAKIIANWVDRNDSKILSRNNKYEFNLVYKKSRDGFDYMKLYEKCNRQGPFIVLIKVQSNKIYGGYNPIGYALRRNQWLATPDSFIFSFENDQDVRNMKIGRVINHPRAIYENCASIPYFLNFGGHLYIPVCQNYKGRYLNNLYLDNYNNYDNVFNVNASKYISLPIEEIEVFRLTKKSFLD